MANDNYKFYCDQRGFDYVRFREYAGIFAFDANIEISKAEEMAFNELIKEQQNETARSYNNRNLQNNSRR